MKIGVTERGDAGIDFSWKDKSHTVDGMILITKAINNVFLRHLFSLADAWKEPPKEERMDCIMCGGKNTLVGHRARVNGHFHGKCEQCGCKIME